MPRSIPDIEDLTDFNNFLDEIDSPPLPQHPTPKKYSKESWFVIDHKGWHRHSISRLAAAQMDREGVAKYVRQIEGEHFTTYLRWRKHLPGSAGPRPSEVVDEYDDSIDEDFNEGLTDPSHIREFYKGCYAPKLGEEVDLFTGLPVTQEDVMTGIKANPVDSSETLDPTQENTELKDLVDQISNNRMASPSPASEVEEDSPLLTEPRADRACKEEVEGRPLKDRISSPQIGRNT